MVVVTAHRLVIENHGSDRVAGPDRGLDVQAGHSECGVAHDVHAELGRVSDLGADHEGDSVAQVCGLAPADVGVRHGRRVERHHLVPRVPGVVGRNRVFVVHDLVDLCDHPVRVHRGAVVRQVWGPLGLPLGPYGGNTVGGGVVAPAPIFTDRGLDLFDHGLQNQLRVPDDAEVYRVVLVDVLGGNGGVDEELAVRDLDPVIGTGKTGADGKQGVGISEPLPDRLGRGPIGRAERERMGVRERALGLHRGHHRDLRELGELHQFRRCAGIKHALSCPDRRVGGREKLLDRVLDVGLVRRRLDRRCGLVGGPLLRNFLRQDVAVQLE